MHQIIHYVIHPVLIHAPNSMLFQVTIIFKSHLLALVQSNFFYIVFMKVCFNSSLIFVVILYFDPYFQAAYAAIHKAHRTYSPNHVQAAYLSGYLYSSPLPLLIT